MKDIPTPETDRNTWDADLGNMVVYADIAKSLEQRLAHAVEALEEMHDQIVVRNARIAVLEKNENTIARADWMPIETAPKDGTRVLIANDEGAIDVSSFASSWHDRTEFVRKAKDGDVFRTVREDLGYWDTDVAYCPIKWMPLPFDSEKRDAYLRIAELLQAAITFKNYADDRYNKDPRSCAIINTPIQQRLWLAIDAAREEK